MVSLSRPIQSDSRADLTFARHNQGTSTTPLSHNCLRPPQALNKPTLRPFTQPILIPRHRVSVAPECISAFNELKLGKDIKWIIYKISDDWKEIVVEETSKDPDYGVFREKLLNAKSKDKRGKEGIGGRYAVFDIQYELESGEGTRNKITFISWSPDDAPQYVSHCAIFALSMGRENGC
jgi:Cofilin/tropomyosin-type actin-binding protein